MKNRPLLLLTAALLLTGCAIYSPVSSQTTSKTSEGGSSESSSISSSESSVASSESSAVSSTESSQSSASSASSSGQSSVSSQSSASSEEKSSESSEEKSSASSEEASTPVEKKKLSYTIKDYLNHGYYGTPDTPLTGDLNFLVIPVWFTDSSTYITDKATVRNDIEKAYFGTEEETGWESVATYYSKLSHGALNIGGTVSEWYEPGKKGSTISESDTETLVKNAVNWYRANHSTDLTEYDQNKDGYLDSVMLIYGVPDYDSMHGSNDNLWAYTFWLDNASLCSTSKPGPNTFFWASYDFIYGSNKSSYYYGDTRHCNVDAHTFIHETGHCFGFDDYYDYSQQATPAGSLTMQDANVGSHDPFSALLAGWADAYVPTASCEITLKPFQESGEVILLSPNGTNSPFDEYLLLEYYTPTGLNKFDSTYNYMNSADYAFPNGSGIRVWHVDGRVVSNAGSARASNITNDPTKSNVLFAMSNTYYKRGYDGYYSPLGQSYADYNLLQLISTSTTASAKRTSNFSSKDLFLKDASFSMSTYASQFQNDGKLNSNTELGFSFKITGLTSESATIKITKG